MKLVRFGNRGAEKPGLIDGSGAIRDLSAHVPTSPARTCRRPSLDKLRASIPQSLPPAPAGVRLGAPVAGTRTFIAIGLNYADHAKETGQEIPAEPILFNKLGNCIVGPNDDIMYPRDSPTAWTGRWRSPSSSARAPATSTRRTPWRTSPATACATTCPSAASR